jgi:hypothetical protein
MPNVIHPKRIEVAGAFFEVVSYSPLTDQQVMNVVRQHLFRHKLRKRDKGKVLQIVTVLDDQSARLFG